MNSKSEDTYAVVAAGQTVESYRVIVDNAGDAQHAANATTRPIGCSGVDGASAGNKFALGAFGRRKLTASGVIAKYAEVVAAANGKIATSVGTAGEYVIGYALEAAAADNDIIEVVFTTLRPVNP